MNREQLRTILWLRWRLTRNQWRRSGGLGGAVTMLIAVGAITLGGLSFVGGLLGAIFGLAEASSFVVLIVWLAVTIAFLSFWLIGLLAATNAVWSTSFTCMPACLRNRCEPAPWPFGTSRL